MTTLTVSTLTVSNLAKRYGTITAVKDVSFCVSPGEIVGLLGPNGAGKSTTVGMIFGAVIPDSGQIAVSRDRSSSRSSAQAISYAPCSSLTRIDLVVPGSSRGMDP